MISFARIKEILDESVDGWSNRTGQEPFLGIHSDNFYWDTRDELLAATAFDLRLIEPVKIGNGLGHQTHLVMAFRNGAVNEQGNSFPRMPYRGPYLDNNLIQEIEEWINQGCPE